MSADAPALSAVLVLAGPFAAVRRTVAALRAQTVCDRIELVLVASDPAVLSLAPPTELEGFHSVTPVFAGPIDNVDHAAAPGLLAARAPIVATIEDHAFPEPGWAAATLAMWAQGAAHRAWGAVGGAVLNANPATGLSWTNMLIAYGAWRAARAGGPIDWLPAHNVTMRRDLVAAHAAALPGMLGREGLLLKAIEAAGHPFAFAPDARLTHINPSTLQATAALRFDAGRLYGARRCSEECWGWAKRLVYIAAGPLIPFLRYKRLSAELLNPPPPGLPSTARASLFLGLVFDAAGQMMGYAAGPGGAPERLAVFEMDRMQHITGADRAAFAS